MIGKVEARGVVKVSWLNGDAMGRWNAFVGNHPLGSIYHLSGWKDSLESGFPHMKVPFHVRKSALQAVLPPRQVVDRSKWMVPYERIPSPHGVTVQPTYLHYSPRFNFTDH